MTGRKTLDWEGLSEAELENIESALDAWETQSRLGTDGSGLSAIDVCANAKLLPFIDERIQDLRRISPFLSPALETPAAEIPAQIGPITIVGVISRRALCDVYLGEQENPRRQVAVKVLHLNASNKRIENAFRKEIEFLSKLRHPGIAEIFLAGSEDNHTSPLLFYAMEYLNGPPLTDFAEQQEKSLRERIELFLPVCQAVAHAHQHAVIHRDLKPTNILTHDGQPRILDFGISRLLHETGTVHADVGVGTPGYISPEQFAEDTPQDTRSDIFSLGVTLYELLSATLPYAQSVTSLATAANAISNHDFVALSNRLDHCSPDLEAITNKCLQVDPDERYQSVELLVEDLQRFLAGEEVLARPRGRLETFSNWGRRHPWTTASIVSSAACVLLVAAVSLFYWRRAEQSADGLKVVLTELRQLRESDQVARHRLDKELRMRRRSALNRVLSNSDQHWRSSPDLVNQWLDEAEATGLAHETFAWRTILHRTRRVEKEFQAHETGLYQVSISSDGKRMASASLGGVVKFWEMENEQLLFRFELGNLRVRSCDLSPAGDRILLLNRTKLNVLDPIGGRVIASVPVKADAFWEARFSPTGDLVYARGHQNEVHVWVNGLRGKARILTAPFSKILYAKMNSDSSALLAIGPKGQYVIWDLANEEIRSSRVSPGRKVHAFSATDDLQVIATAEQYTNLFVDDLNEPSTSRMVSRGERFDELSFSKKGEWLLSLSRQRISARSLESAGQIEWTQKTEANPTCVDFMPDGKTFLVGLSDGRIQVRRFSAETISTVLAKGIEEPRSIAINHAGRLLAVSGKSISLFDVDQTIPLQVVPYETACPDAVWAEDILYAVTAKQKTLLQFDTPTQGPATVLTTERPATSVAYASDRLYVGLAGGKVIQLGTSEPRNQTTWKAHQETVTALELDRKAKLIVSGSESGEVALWNTDRELIHRIQVHRGAITRFAFADSAQKLYCSSRDRSVGVIDLKNMTVLPPLRLGVDRIRSVSVSPDGQTLAIAGEGSDILVCDAITGEFQLRLSGHTDTVVGVCFSPDGNAMFSVSHDGTLRRWLP